MLASIMLAATTMVAPSKAETDAIFAAAGGARRGANWTWSREDPRAKLRIDLYRDLNGDGLTDVVVVEDSTMHGAAGQAFALVAQGPRGRWRKLHQSSGVPEVLDPRGKGIWPDIRIAGPGFCFPVVRWNGRAYANHRTEYLGKPCKR